jgi:hypothetical protein
VVSPRRSIAAASAALILGLVTSASCGWADHGPGVPVRTCVPRNVDESEIVRLIRIVADGWMQKNADLILSAYAPDAVQRAWNEPTRMIGVGGIRSEALGAFADPRLGRVLRTGSTECTSSTRRPSSRSTKDSTDGGVTTTTATSGCSHAAMAAGGCSGMTTSRSRPSSRRGENAPEQPPRQSPRLSCTRAAVWLPSAP